jgi:hypothetical protein
MPNAFSAATLFFYGKGEMGLNLGTKSELKDYEQWYKNVRLMHAVSEEFQIPYLCFLQPVLGEGAYEISPEEQAMLDKTIAQHASRRDYLADVNGFYRGARELSKVTPYIVDLTGVFDSQQAMYMDARHQSLAGVQVLAKSILERCMSLGVFRDKGILIAPNASSSIRKEAHDVP